MYKPQSNPSRYAYICPFTPNTQVDFYFQFSDSFKVKKNSKYTNSNAYRQRFGNSYLDFAKLGTLQGLNSILQAGVVKVGGVNVHETVSWQQSSILLGHAIGNQRTNHDHRLGGIQWVLWQRSSQEANSNSFKLYMEITENLMCLEDITQFVTFSVEILFYLTRL